MSYWQRHAGQVPAIVVTLVLLGFARPPTLSSDERAELAARFAFSPLPIPELSGVRTQVRRPVNPALERHARWISAVGAAIALGDLDGDGLPNDFCQVEPRNDLVLVGPVPGTAPRYPLFALDTGDLAYAASTSAPMGCVPGDFNEDGRIDLFVYYWGRPGIFFLRNSHDGLAAAAYTQRDLTAPDERWYSNAATFADLDGDGHLDLVIGNYFQDDARIIDAAATSPDVMQDSMSRAFNGGRNRLFRWATATAGAAPSVTYQEVPDAFDARADAAWTLAVGAADLDGDLRPEIYFANDFGPDRLFHNRSQPGEFRFSRLDGVKHFTTPNSKVLGNDSFKGMGVDFADLNGDGWLDFFVSNIAAEYALEESHFLFMSTGDVDEMAEGVAPYDDRSEGLGVSRSGWGWDTRFGDFDNDGTQEALQATGFVKGDVERWPELQELAMANDDLLRRSWAWLRVQAGDDLSGHQPNPFYALAPEGRYYDISAELGIDDPFVTRGIATADVDGDGDLDFAYANQWEPSVFYRNDSPQAGAFLGLHLLVPVDDGRSLSVRDGHPKPDIRGRPAIGASARVLRHDGPPLVAQVDGGNGHSGVRSPDLHFGLGDRDEAVDVELRWRDASGNARTTTLTLAPGWHTVLLGGGALEGGRS